MIVRSRLVVPMEGAPISDGAVVVQGKKITDVGRFEEVNLRHSGDVLDLGEQVLLPGLINAHCHLDYTTLRGKIPPQESFAEWIRAINAHKAALSKADYLNSIAAGLAEAESFGTTSILNLEAFPSLVMEVPRPSLRVWWCAEMIDLRQRVDVKEVADNLGRWFDAHPDWLGGFGLSPHAPYTASPQLYSQASKIGEQHDVPLSTHLAESIEELQAFRDASGPLFDFLKSIGHPMENAGRETSLSFLIRNGVAGPRWIIAHLNELDAGDFDLLRDTTKFHIAHCPRSHTFFRHAPFAYRRLRTLGFNICVGTDSLASNTSLSLFAELRELMRKEPWLSPEEALATITVNAAAALGRASSLGRIRAGFLADLIALPIAPSETDVFESIVAFEHTVPWIMVNGTVIRAD
ncbi:MAG: amidohydrolase family protein [Chthoniobacterales bacterium]